MPKIRRFELEVAGTPAEVAERLRARTRWRLMPHTVSLLGRGELGGRVTDDGFSVSIDPRAGFRQRILPVARGRLEVAGPGRTRVVGECGMPPALVWYLRIVWLLLPFLVGGVLWTSSTSADATWPLLLGWAALAITAATAGIGLNVSAADERVDEVTDAVLATVGAGASASAGPVRVARRETEPA